MNKLTCKKPCTLGGLLWWMGKYLNIIFSLRSTLNYLTQKYDSERSLMIILWRKIITDLLIENNFHYEMFTVKRLYNLND